MVQLVVIDNGLESLSHAAEGRLNALATEAARQLRCLARCEKKEKRWQGFFNCNLEHVSFQKPEATCRLTDLARCKNK